MTAPDPGRRRLLGLLGAAIGAAAVGAVAWWRVPGGISTDTTLRAGTSAPSSTTSSSTSTLPPTTTTQGAATTTPAPEPTTTRAAGTVIAVIGRDGWGARSAGDELVAHTIARVTVHHTAVVLETNADAPAAIRRHQDFHIDFRGWPDLAYHYVIDAAGNVYEGRDPAFAGDTATEYDPTGHLLVCCEGHFGRQALPDAQRVSLEAMVAWALAAYDLAADTIAGHGDYARTTCPGDALRTLIADGTLQATVTERLDTRSHTLQLLTGDEAAALVAAIEG